MQYRNPALKNYGGGVYPLGWRFSPTDVEAIYCYLKNKVENRPLPPVGIMEVDIYEFNPQDLAMYRPNCDKPKEWYFFTPRDRKYRNGKRPNRQAGDGFWRATGADKEVKTKGEVIGWKRALVYYCGKPRKGEKTNWIMHEYMLKDAHPSSTFDTSSNDMKLDVCVLCKIYKNTRKFDIEQEQSTSQNHTLYASQNQISSSYQYGAQATNVNSFQNQPSSSYQGMQLGAQVSSAEDNFQSQPSSFHQCQQLGGQKEPRTTISYSSMMTPYDPMIAMSVNGFQNQPSSSYQGMQLGAQAASVENNFQSQPPSSHQYQPVGGQQEPISYSSMMTTYDPMIATSVNDFQNQPSSSYPGMQLGAQATSTENNFQSQPSSFHQSRQLGDQQEPDTTISYSSMMTTYDPMIDNTTTYFQMEYLNPTPLQIFPPAFDPQEYYVNTEMENNVNDVLFP
ncbi:hypothetical protein K2173_020344 [Erythroxylum novogranatense]|uniref:NAC domain-containing protein n=1 Tax=Erythroxylum novogranatense TaxID=1862640 RepID=A0AAV8UAG2_9ROSI|nr:hypothetical protein K2173_020344 [Erythroxylum novogranatense]